MIRRIGIIGVTMRDGLIALVVWFALGHLLLADENNLSAVGRPPQRVKLKGTDEELYGSYKDKSLKELWDIRKEFFKSGQIPTGSNEVRRLWQWYRTMDEKDPTFGSKTSIEFYGRVIDQYAQPVSGAVVDMRWGKGENEVRRTPSDGYFSLTGVSGSALSVLVYKDGYLTGKPSIKCFDYANWFDLYFHIPNPTNPVIFRLMKLENPEPMHVCSSSIRLDVAGSVTWVDFSTGKKGESGDIGFSVVRDDIPGNWYSGYTLTIQTPEGGGMVATNEEFMFGAPEIGYIDKIIIRENPGKADSTSFKNTQSLTLYVKTWDAKYAAVKVDVSQAQAPAAYADCVIFFNPSGSRNLELGPNNRLDAGEAKRIRDKAQQTGAYH